MVSVGQRVVCNVHRSRVKSITYPPVDFAIVSEAVHRNRLQLLDGEARLDGPALVTAFNATYGYIFRYFFKINGLMNGFKKI